jgi:putative membrane protein
MDILKIFDEAARSRVAEAVHRAEHRSHGQIVPAVVGRSDAYPEARFRGALLGVALATGVVLLLDLPVSLAELPAIQLVAGLLGGLAALWPPLERQLIGRRAMEQAVRSRALRAFHEHGLHRTTQGTGVLVFASLLERRAVVLGDHGIHARMGDDGWSDAVAALVEGLSRDAPGEGFLEAITRCGARLEQHFPREASETEPPNELPDALRVSRS